MEKFPQLLPIREASIESVRYAADRIDDKIKFTDEACAMMVKVPRINDKRAKEKSK
jgi:hypothetical protein